MAATAMATSLGAPPAARARASPWASSRLGGGGLGVAAPPPGLATRLPSRAGGVWVGAGVRTRRVATTAIFNLFGKKEKDLGHFMTTDLGKSVSSGIQEANAAQALSKYHSGKGDLRLIDGQARLIMATVINKLIDIPIIGEAQEQVIFMKLVDIVADQIEAVAKEAGFADFQAKSATEKLAWKDEFVDKVNAKVDLPILNEAQERVLINAAVEMFLGRFYK